MSEINDTCVIVDYDHMKIDVTDLMAGLATYVKAVLWRMQKADPKYENCWTACVITFNGLQPEFTWGSIEDIEKDEGIYIEVPLDANK